MEGRRSNGPNGAMSCAMSMSGMDRCAAGRRRLGAGVVLLGADGAILHVRGSVGIALLKLPQCDAGVFLLPLLAQRHGKLQQVVRRLLAVGILLVTLGERDRRALEVVAHIV